MIKCLAPRHLISLKNYHRNIKLKFVNKSKRETKIRTAQCVSYDHKRFLSMINEIRDSPCASFAD